MPLKSNVAIDGTDEKILQVLLQDARTSLSDLAGKCGVTSSAILRRIKKLENSGVILGTELWLRRGTLGYPYQGTIGINAETACLDQIAEALKKHPNIVVYCKAVGMYNMFCLPIARSTDELHSIAQWVRDIPGVQGIAINIWVEEPFIKSLYGGSIKPNSQLKDIHIQIDETDIQIIRQLQVDARASFVEIGKKLKVSHETVRKRFEFMVGNGTITGSSIVVDWFKLGYQGTLFILITLKQGIQKCDVFEALKTVSGVTLMTKVMGPYDIQVHGKVRDLREYAKLVDEIQRIPGVNRATACFATFTYFSFIEKPRMPIKCDTLELS